MPASRTSIVDRPDTLRSIAIRKPEHVHWVCTRYVRLRLSHPHLMRRPAPVPGSPSMRPLAHRDTAVLLMLPGTQSEAGSVGSGVETDARLDPQTCKAISRYTLQASFDVYREMRTASSTTVLSLKTRALPSAASCARMTAAPSVSRCGSADRCLSITSFEKIRCTLDVCKKAHTHVL
jgi:hypothetical protein